MRQCWILLAVAVLLVWAGCGAEPGRTGKPGAEITLEGEGTVPEGESPTLEEESEIGQGTPDTTSPETGVAQLERFASAEELETYFDEQIVARNSEFGPFPGALDLVIGSDAVFDVFQDDFGVGAEGEGEGEGGAEYLGLAAPPAEGGFFSTTTTQEEGVAEADVVKTDGTHLYIMTEKWGSGSEPITELHIVRAVPAEDMQLLSYALLEGSQGELYLAGDSVVAVTSRVEYPDYFATLELVYFVLDGFLEALIAGEAGDAAAGREGNEVDRFMDLLAAVYPRQETVVSVLDVSDRSDPTLVSKTVFQGRAASSRMTDGVLRLVVANYPNDYFDVLPLGMPQVERLLQVIDLDRLLPDFETTTADGTTMAGNIVEWADVFRPADPDGFGLAAVITLDPADQGSFDAVGILAEPGLMYASTEAVYLTDTDHFFDFRRVDTDIYKFAFEKRTASLVGAGTVPGRILNQYSMGEYQGFLRVATTTDGLFVWETGQEIPSSNNVYVLGQEEGGLAIVGSVEGFGVTEQIQAARFIGPRGYVVTFQQIDPLFTLDLGVPTDPRVVGELEVPGFSTFLTPLDEGHLLGAGLYVDPEGWGWSGGIQLSIFDVSDLAEPRRTHNLVIGDWDTYSEATWDPKAITYFPAQDLLALPIEQYGYFATDGWFGTDGWFDTDGLEEIGDGEVDPQGSPRGNPTPPFEEGESFQGIFVYRVTPDDGFDYLGRVSTSLQDPGDPFWSGWLPG
ncbi:MAG: beta-propeller domain-containing protein, partial [Planctomycetota bacterium]